MMDCLAARSYAVKLDDSRLSDNVEDRRGSSFGGYGLHLGIGGTLVVLVAGYFLGVNPLTLLSLINGAPDASSSAPANPAVTDPSSDKQVLFVREVLRETEDVWAAHFQQRGQTYTAPKLVLFSGAISSACGLANAAAGPFYCPGDQRVYLDLSFFQQLSSQFGAPGDFARAYVIAHEVGHHVQNLLGISGAAERAEQRTSQIGAKHVSIEVELQADCYAGVWAEQANQARKILEPGDLEQGLQAASAVGDDTLQKRMQGTVVPDSFTHGTSAQRVRWFRRGFETGASRIATPLTPAPHFETGTAPARGAAALRWNRRHKTDTRRYSLGRPVAGEPPMNTNTAALEAAHSQVGPRFDYRPGPATAVIFIGLLGFGLLCTAYSLMSDVSSAGVPTRNLAPFILLGVGSLIALGFEFVNGFHDTANAVATVIYTHSLPPHLAVLWSGAFNFLGVLASSGAVAFGIISLLPVELILRCGRAGRTCTPRWRTCGSCSTWHTIGHPCFFFSISCSAAPTLTTAVKAPRRWCAACSTPEPSAC